MTLFDHERLLVIDTRAAFYEMTVMKKILIINYNKYQNLSFKLQLQ